MKLKNIEFGEKIKSGEDGQKLTQLVEIIRNIKKRNNECKVCSERGHCTKECVNDQNENCHYIEEDVDD
jgi:hypothetical protein